MPEWLAIVIVTAVCTGFVAAVGYFLKKFFDGFIEKQETLITAIHELTLILTKLDGKVELYKANSDRIENTVDDVKQRVDALGVRLISLEKDHAANMAAGSKPCKKAGE